MRVTQPTALPMSQSSADLIAGWKAERTTLARKIAILQNSESSLTANEIQAAVKNMSDLMAEYDALIADFSRHEPIPIIFDPAEIDEAAPITRFRFVHDDAPVDTQPT